MCRVQHVGCVLVTISIVGHVQAVVPPFEDQDRFAILSVMVQSCFYERFVVVRVSLGADQHSVQSRVDLFEEGMRQIVNNPMMSPGNKLVVSFFLATNSTSK